MLFLGCFRFSSNVWEILLVGFFVVMEVMVWVFRCVVSVLVFMLGWMLSSIISCFCGVGVVVVCLVLVEVWCSVLCNSVVSFLLLVFMLM